jgi:hypothetical protein
MYQDDIVIKGARVHNLKNLSLTIPRDKLVVITVFPAPVNLHLHSTPCLQKGKDVMWRAFRLMHVNFWDV